MKKINKLLLLPLLLFSCTKQEFSTNKSSQSSAINKASSSDTKLCSQYTLIKPKVDILMLWDNTSSFNFITPESKASMGNLIKSVSENFDYHLLSAPLVPKISTNLYEATLVASDTTSVSGTAASILKTKDQAIASLAFSPGIGSAEKGIDQAYQLITNNRSNGIFRDGAYTIIVLMSNEDDKGCEIQNGVNQCRNYSKDSYLAPFKQKFMCLRGSSKLYDCTGYPTLNSTMMRFITISPVDLTKNSCAANLNIPVADNYSQMAKFLYQQPYYEYNLDGSVKSSWSANDHLNPDVSGLYDSYNLCTISFSNIFDGVNTAIKQTVIKHVYSYWPVASTTTDIDESALAVDVIDGTNGSIIKSLVNRTGQSNPTDGFAYIGNQTNHTTRTYPSDGEYYTGKMIQLFGSNNNDLVVYPNCLKVHTEDVKLKYGYIYLQNGQPYTPSIEVTINGSVVPQSTTNGWSYMGKQAISSLPDVSSLKVANLPSGITEGYIIKLNGTYQVTNNSSVDIKVFYTSSSN